MRGSGFARFGVLQERVQRGHPRDGEALESHPGNRAQKVRAQKSPRRDRRPVGRTSTPRPRATIHCAARRRVPVHSAQVLGKRIAGEVQKFLVRARPPLPFTFTLSCTNSPIHRAFVPVVKPHLAVRIPAAMQNPAAHILRHARHGVGVERGPVPFFMSRSRLPAFSLSASSASSDRIQSEGACSAAKFFCAAYPSQAARSPARPGSARSRACGPLIRCPPPGFHRSTACSQWRARYCVLH